jgi:hypothetical protein
MLERSPHREAFQIVDVSDFRTGVDVLFVHGSLAGRLTRPPTCCAAHSPKAASPCIRKTPWRVFAGRPAEANPARAI